MPSNGLILIGTNLMVLAHVHSFVLLTANFDDVKKLAQKFVSESVAESIAEFVAKASGNKIATKTSKEMNLPKSRDQLESDSLSDEDKDTNVTKESISKENMKYKSKILNTIKHKEKPQSKFMNASEKQTNKKKEKKHKVNKEYISKSNNFSDFSEDSANNNVSMESTAGYQDEKRPYKDLPSDQDEKRPYKDLPSDHEEHRPDHDEEQTDYAFRLKNDSEEGRKKFKMDRSFTLTTRKEKYEFDQYENINYPKAVATSGSVTLTFLKSRKSRYRDQSLSEINDSR